MFPPYDLDHELAERIAEGETWLRVFRLARSIRPADIARRSGLSISRVLWIDAGVEAPTDDEINALAKALQVNRCDIERWL